MTRLDFEAVNARGVTIRTFDRLELAKAWVREHAPEHDGLHVQAVTTTTRREAVYHPRANLRVVA